MRKLLSQPRTLRIIIILIAGQLCILLFAAGNGITSRIISAVMCVICALILSRAWTLTSPSCTCLPVNDDTITTSNDGSA